MKIGKLSCALLRIPFTFPLVTETQHALANFVELETDDGLKGHALSTYPMPHGVREFTCSNPPRLKRLPLKWKLSTNRASRRWKNSSGISRASSSSCKPMPGS